MLSGDINLIEAIKSGDKQLALKLIQDGADVNKEEEYETPLSVAIDQEDNEILLALIKKGVDVNQVDSTIRTPLIHAMNVKNFKKIMQILIDNGANLDQKISLGERNTVTPLAVACEMAEPEIISFLIDKGADVNWVNEQGDSLFLFVMRTLEWTELGKQSNNIDEEVYVDNKNKVNLSIKELLKRKPLVNVQDKVVVEKILESAIKFDVPSFSEIYDQLRQSAFSSMVGQKALEVAFKYQKKGITDYLWREGVLSDQEKTEIIKNKVIFGGEISFLNSFLNDEWVFENTLDLAIKGDASVFSEIYEYFHKDASLREKGYQKTMEILAKYYKAKDYFDPVNILNTLFKNGEKALASGENKTLPPLLLEGWLTNIYAKLTCSEWDKLSRFYFPYYRFTDKVLKEYFSKIHQRIIIDKKERQFKELLPLAQVNLPWQVIYNNDSCLQSTDNESFKNFIKGNTLQYDETPIGYNIHLPIKDIKAVYFYVYGGKQKGTSYHLPDELSSMERYLLPQGIAVVTLNLPDLLELSVSQPNMPEQLHDKIHACINHVYHIFRTNPESLHPQLLNLYGKRFILSGESFGGRTAIMQAELYPNTFDGYISFEGGLSDKMRANSDFPQLQRGELLPHLDPANENRMKKIAQDILIIQNRNDMNVNAKVALDFYHKMKKLGKSERVRLWMVDEGGGEECNKGHGLTTDPHDRFYVMWVVQQFITEGKSKLDTLHEWRAYKHDLLANKHCRKATAMEKFLAEVFQLELPSKTKINRENMDVLWEEHYAPIFRAHFYAKELSENSTLLSPEADYLQHSLSDQHIINTLQSQKQLLIKFFRDELEITLTPQEFEEELKKPNIINSFRTLITTLQKQSNAYIHYFLNTIYQANPDLTQGTRFQRYSLESKLNAQLPEAKQKLLSVYLKEKRMITLAWQEAAKKAREADPSKSSEPPSIGKKQSSHKK